MVLNYFLGGWFDGWSARDCSAFLKMLPTPRGQKAENEPVRAKGSEQVLLFFSINSH